MTLGDSDMELGSVTLKRIGFFCFPFLNTQHTRKILCHAVSKGQILYSLPSVYYGAPDRRANRHGSGGLGKLSAAGRRAAALARRVARSAALGKSKHGVRSATLSGHDANPLSRHDSGSGSATLSRHDASKLALCSSICRTA